jgi:hypothetical protein
MPARHCEGRKPGRAWGGEADKTMDVRARDAAVGTRRPFQLPVGEVVDGPTGACDRVLIGSNPRPAFSATVGEFGCGTFAAAPPPPPMPKGGGFVTIWQGGPVVWETMRKRSPPVSSRRISTCDQPGQSSSIKSA